MRHVSFVLVCVLALILSVPAPADTSTHDPVTKVLRERTRLGPYGDAGGRL
jgi:hypothetical protein